MYHRELIRWCLEEHSRNYATIMDGLSAEERRHQPTPECNHVDFIVWHIIRVEDMWIQNFAQKKPTIWEQGGWAEKLGIDTNDLGFGYTAEQVRDLPAYDPDLMDEYRNEVRQSTFAYIDASTEEELSEPKEIPFWKPFSIGHALMRIQVELNQHLGHMGYIRGIIRGINK